MKNKIFIKQWLELKPYDKQTATDSYYLMLSNKIKKSFSATDSTILLKYINEQEIDLLSCFLVSWFEDIISETNIWNAFSDVHLEHYKKRLPFYDTTEYFEGEINLQDIAFLTWYFLNTIQAEKFISPFNDFIINIAEKVFIILEEEYEYAPENTLIKSYYTIDKNETDFYIARNVIDILLFKTYLFYPDTSLRLAEQEGELLKKGNDENLLSFLNENRDSFLHKNRTRLMSLKGKEWAANILGNNHPVSTHLINISQRITGYFLYKGQDDFDIFLEHIASGKKFKLTKKSFDRYMALKETDTIIYIGIVQWRNEWWFSGVYFQTDFNADLILDEKNSLESRKQVAFLDHNSQESLIEQQLRAFMAFNNGAQIAFMPSDKIEEFIKKYLDYFNNTLNLTDEKIKEARKRAKEDGYFGGEEKSKINFSEISETGLVFFNPKSGVEIGLGINSAFPLINNPYFNAGDSEDAIFHLFMSEDMSTELSIFCIEHCKADLPFFKEGIGKLYVEDIDFLLRFWKRENYYAAPSITYTGQKE